MFRPGFEARNMYEMIITIDGPAGSGKSTAARKLAARLEIPYLDTGAMYRAVAHTALLRGVDVENPDALLALARSIRLDVDYGPTHTRIRVDGHDVTEAVRGIEVSRFTSRVARHPDIRAMLVQQQRDIAARAGSVVTEGRDQGAVVFPEADAKFVLMADLDARARRRYQEMTADGEEVTLEDVSQSLSIRDTADARQWEPLLKSGDAIVIDTSDMTIQEVVDSLASRLPGRT